MKKHYYTDEILQICDNHHLTVDEIFEQIQKKFPDAGRSSIYRNVEKMTKDNLLTKINGVGNKALFEKTKHDHAHFVCQNSGKVYDIELDSLKILDGKIPEEYKVKGVDIKIYGEKITTP
jgi:Fe2+ or Zn2+ uptake regulation protein